MVWSEGTAGRVVSNRRTAAYRGGRSHDTGVVREVGIWMNGLQLELLGEVALCQWHVSGVQLLVV